MLLFFDTKLISFTENFSVTILNILLFILIFFAAKFSKIYAAKIVRTRFKTQQIKVGDREFTVLQLVKQLINIVGIILAIQSITINNEFQGLKDILEFKLFSVDDFHISIYNILLVLILFFSAKLLNTIIRLFILKNLSEKQWISEGKQYTVVIFAQYIIYFIFILIGIRSMGINLTAFLVSFTALLVGLGLALQHFIRDIISGFVILFEGTVKVGEIIEVDKIIGRVVEVNLRMSKIKTRDGNIYIIPNTKITSENINHLSQNNKPVRISVSFLVSHQNNIDSVKNILNNSVLTNRMVDIKKHTHVLLEEINEKGILLSIYFYTSHVLDIPNIKSDVRYSVYEAFKKENILIPIDNERNIVLKNPNGPESHS